MSKDTAKRKAYALRTIALGRELIRIGENALLVLDARPKEVSPQPTKPKSSSRSVPISTGP